MSQKNDTDVIHYNYGIHEEILIIFLADMLPIK